MLVALLPVAARAQSKVEGTVTDGSTNRPAAGVQVRMVSPREGKQVATATTGADGRFTLQPPGLDTTFFYMVTADYQGASYNAPVRFDSNGPAEVPLTVYDSTRSTAGVRIPALQVLAGAEGAQLRVQEKYAIQNSTNPPVAFAPPGSSFTFRIPAKAGEPTVSATGLMNTELPQTPLPGKRPGEFSIEYPLKPGVTTLTVQYTMPYDAAGVELRDGASLPIDQAELYVYPSSLAVSAPGFQQAGIDNPHQIEKYQAPQLSSLAAGVSIRLSGASAAGPPPDSSQPEQGQSGAQGQSDNQGQGEVKIVPNSTAALALPVLAGFLLLLLWALGVRFAKDWPRLKTLAAGGPASPPLDAKTDKLLNSIADLDELFATGKVAEPNYWKERLELKARLVAVLKKTRPALSDSHAARSQPR
ncbi:MAG TPA: carboxypeptidase regulatory-like domain-containing protein [Terriglobia bacterium]|nr:carboxypeptidase regulatory-like domain-containing protein [Terriglobia bacterium]